MKTSGVIRIGAIIFLSSSAVFLSSDALSQLYYASQKKISAASTHTDFTVYRNSFNERTIAADENYHSLNDFSIVSFKNIMNGGDSVTYREKSDSLTEITGSNTEDGETNFRTTSFVYPVNSRKDIGITEYSPELLLIYAKALKEYAKNNGFDTSYAFLTNMGMLCNKKRFFVVNLVTMEIEQSGLVSHGRGQGATIYDKQYSNIAGSRCTSLGRYKILGKYRGSYGESYRLAGLDTSNQNAFDRNIVLHSMNCIPDIENSFPACVSDGCPAVSGKFLSALSRIIDARKEPILLWIFDSNLEEPVIEENHAEAISAGLCSTTKNCFTIQSNHVDEHLETVVSKSIHENRFILWLSKKANEILKCGSRVVNYLRN